MRTRLHYSPVSALTRGLCIRSSYATVPICLAPAALILPRAESQRKRPLCSTRCQHYAAAETRVIAPVDASASLVTPTPEHEEDSSALPKRHLSQDEWIRLLDQYLPLELRSQGWLENLAGFQGVRPIHAIPTLLIEARASFKLGMLAYLGIDQRRWTALLWLIKELLKSELLGHVTPSIVVGDELLQYGHESLDVLTQGYVTAERSPKHSRCHTTRSHTITLDQITANNEPTGPGITPNSMRDAIGQIWQSVARILIEAAELDSAKCQNMMSYAHSIIALMHHHGCMPVSIYEFNSQVTPSYVRKPPMLNRLSRRILFILWRAREQEIVAEAAAVGAEHVYKGYELPRAMDQLRVPYLGPQVWLELVLWSCIESAMVPDAAKIVAEISKLKGDQKWTVMAWSTLRKHASYRSTDDSKPSRTLPQRWRDAAKGPHKWHTEAKLPERTVSSEAIAAIADGLLSTTREAHIKSGMRSNAVRFHVNLCRLLLRRQETSLSPHLWNSIVIRLLEFDHYAPKSLPGILDRILDLTKRDKKRSQMFEQEDFDNDVDHSTANLGLLHEALDAYIRLADIDGALRMFRRLQNWVDEHRVHTVKEFWENFQSMPEMNETESNNDISGVYYQIPQVTLAAFLDLITNAKMYDLGNWLLYSKEVDGPMISPILYRSPLLQPALLRYALATADNDLLSRITEAVAATSETYSKEILRAVLHCQIKLNSWQEVRELLQHMTEERKLRVEACDIMVLAAKVLELDQSAVSNKESHQHFRQAKAVLEYILSGQCQVKPDPSKPRDLSQIRQVNQCRRILASIPGTLRISAQRFVRESGQAHVPVPIPTSAFNILLSAVTEAFGSHAGQALCNEWCDFETDQSVLQDSELEEDSLLQHDDKKWSDGTSPIFQMPQSIVTPSLQTIRIVLEPLLCSQQPGQETPVRTALQYTNNVRNGTQETADARSNQDEMTEEDSNRIGFVLQHEISGSLSAEMSRKMLLDWGTAKYRQIGLSNSDIATILASPQRKVSDSEGTVVWKAGHAQRPAEPS